MFVPWAAGSLGSLSTSFPSGHWGPASKNVIQFQTISALQPTFGSEWDDSSPRPGSAGHTKLRFPETLRLNAQVLMRTALLRACMCLAMRFLTKASTTPMIFSA